jgi:hypothetical protein
MAPIERDLSRLFFFGLNRPHLPRLRCFSIGFFGPTEENGGRGAGGRRFVNRASKKEEEERRGTRKERKKDSGKIYMFAPSGKTNGTNMLVKRIFYLTKIKQSFRKNVLTTIFDFDSDRLF